VSPARRSIKHRGWPRGLIERAGRPGYYTFKHPDGREFALGYIPLAEAKAQANAANLHIAELKPSLVERLTGASNTVAQLIGRMDVPANTFTAKTARSLDRKIVQHFGATAVVLVSTADCARVIESEADSGKARSAQALRSRLSAVFARAVQLGWIDHNPVPATRNPKVTVKRGRLTLDTFRQIHAVADQVAEWLPHAMMLALITGADRSTIVGMQRSDHASGHLTMTRSKTGARIAIPVALRMDCVGVSLADLLAHKTGVVSKYLLHHVDPWGNAPAGSKIHPDRISHAFTEARKLAGLPDEKAPTFHEVRSLASRLYRDQGNVDVQALLGHARAEMTQMYQDPRGVEAIRVRITR
jgi:integrase